jgi:hypothetical protein
MIWKKRQTTRWNLSWRLAGVCITFKMGIGLNSKSSRVVRTKRRSFGLSYSFTLHAPDGTRLVGFDNAHRVARRGARFKRRSEASDHWHRTETDPGRPYEFKDAETLLRDFFREVQRVLTERGIAETVIPVEERKRPT